MAIDPSIALGFRPPEQPSQLNMLANALQVQGLQRQNQLGQMQMEQARAGAERQGQLRNFLAQTDVNTPEGQTALQRAFPMEAPKIIGDVLELGDKRQKLDKGKVDTEAARFELRKNQIAQNLQQLGSIGSPDQAAQWIQGGVQSGLITPEQAQAELSAIPRDPQGFAQWKQAQQQAGMTIVQQMEQQWKAKDFGLNVQKFDEAKRSNRVQEGISAGNLGVARANLGLSAERLKLDKEKASKEPKAEAGKVKDATEAIGLLDMADAIVEKATGSLGGAWWDKTLGAVGAATEGGKAAAQLKALEGMLVSKMPKMSGPQSDKDVLLYRQMAAQIGDETIPREQKKAALATVREIQERYAGVAPGSTKKQPPNATQQTGGATGSWGDEQPQIKFLGFESP